MNKRQIAIFICLILLVGTGFPPSIFAEDKNIPGGIIPKLLKTSNDPELKFKRKILLLTKPKKVAPRTVRLSSSPFLLCSVR